MTPTKAAEDVLVERLRRYSEYVERQLGALTPPDAIDLRVGPRMCVDAMIEAADAITTLLERVAELEKQRLMILAAVYGEAPKFVATICDEQLDRSGALLGEVRALARAALTREGG